MGGLGGGLWTLIFQCGVQNLRESQPVKADVYVCCGVSGSFRLDFDCERAESTHQKYKSVTALSLSLFYFNVSSVIYDTIALYTVVNVVFFICYSILVLVYYCIYHKKTIHTVYIRYTNTVNIL